MPPSRPRTPLQRNEKALKQALAYRKNDHLLLENNDFPVNAELPALKPLKPHKPLGPEAEVGAVAELAPPPKEHTKFAEGRAVAAPKTTQRTMSQPRECSKPSQTQSFLSIQNKLWMHSSPKANARQNV